MTIGEMHASILLKVDKIGSYSTANLIPGEIDDFINDAIDEFIDEQRQIIRQYRYTEGGMEAQENLRTIIERGSITSSNISSTTVLGDVGWEIQPLKTGASPAFPSFDYFISGTAEFEITLPDSSTVNETYVLRHVSSSLLTDKERGAHMNFFDRGIPMTIEGNRMIGFLPRDRDNIPEMVSIAYLNYPEPVRLDTSNPTSNVDCTLPKHTHRDIVNIASIKIIQSLSNQQPNPQQ